MRDNTHQTKPRIKVCVSCVCNPTGVLADTNNTQCTSNSGF